MAGDSGGGLLDWITKPYDKLEGAADYALLLALAHPISSFISGLVAGTVVHFVPKIFKSEINSETVVESETYYEPTGEINPATGKEFYNQVINTQSTFNMRIAFAEATINPSALIKIVKKAAEKCDLDNPIVWLNLHEAMQRESKIFDYLPEKIARRFGHYSLEERKKRVNEIARCIRNYRSEQLNSPTLRTDQIDPRQRERYDWKKDMSVLIFQKGAGADVFTSVKIPEPLLDFQIPAKADTHLIYYDYGQPVTDPDNHLHERAHATEAIQAAIIADRESKNPILEKFFCRYTDGTRKPVPMPV